MISKPIIPEPLTRSAFEPFGEIISLAAARSSVGEPILINNGCCERFSDLAGLDIADAAVGLSLFNAKARAKPVSVDLLERHPLGSQAFIPMNPFAFLVVVAAEGIGAPQTPQVFITDGQQGVNIRRNTWHGVLTVLDPQGGLFAVIDYVGKKENLQEHKLQPPLLVSV